MVIGPHGHPPLDRRRRLVRGRQGQRGRPRPGSSRSTAPAPRCRLRPAGRHPLDRRGQDLDGDPQAGQVRQAGQEARQPPRDPHADFTDADNGFLLRLGRPPVPHPQRAARLDRAAGRGHRRGARHVVLHGAEGLPGHQPLRRRAQADRVPAAHRRRRRDVAPAVRGLQPDRRRRDRRGRRDRLPARRRAVAAYSTTGGDTGATSDLSITSPKRSYAKAAHIVVTGKLKPAAGNERVTVSYRRPGSSPGGRRR